MLDKISSSNNDLNANANPFALDTATDSRWNDAFGSKQPRIRLASSSSSSEQGNNFSNDSDISANGRFVAFDSTASNLVPHDTNGVPDIFVKDIRTGTTNRVSVASDGTQADKASTATAASISRNGRYAVFESRATNLVPDDTNGEEDVFLHDTKKGTTTRISVDSNGNQGNAFSGTPFISANGRYVTFRSAASNLVPDDPNGNGIDTFIRDLQTGSMERVPIPSEVTSAAGDTLVRFKSAAQSISADGRYVVSQASFGRGRQTISNLYVYDQQADSLKQIPKSGSPATSSTISSDGRLIAFTSTFTEPIRIYDQQTDNTQIISFGENNRRNISYDGVSFSDNGRYLAFNSNDDQIVPGDTNNASDVFVYDIKNQSAKRLSVNAEGVEGNSRSESPSISADGRFVSFNSDASNLVANDTNNTTDVFWARNYSA